MYIGQARGGTFQVVGDLGIIDPKEADCGAESALCAAA
jgi:hypothetical protein